MPKESFDAVINPFKDIEMIFEIECFHINYKIVALILN